MPCLVTHHHTVLVLLVAEDPLGANDVLALGSLFKHPHFIASEVVQLLLHSYDPIGVRKSFLYTSRLHTRNK
jgi:hypothetical protein